MDFSALPDLGARDVFDLIVVGILLISGIFAFFRGFIHETLSMMGWVGAGLVALYGYPVARPYVRELIPSELIADLATGVGLFLISFLIFSFISGRIGRAVQNSGLDSLDSTLGFVFGLLRGALIVCIGFLSLSWLLPADSQPDWVRDARTRPVLEEGAFLIMRMAPDEIFDTTAQELERAQREADANEKTYRQLLGLEPKGTGPAPLN
uniref:CvpA family protein n=1 Tax=Thalassospira sp. UBA1131 TaxID=1947672 RepID=UPI0025DD5AD4